MRRVAREAVVVNDLRRGRLAFVMAAAPVLAFTRGRYTRHDGVLARRAYTLAGAGRPGGGGRPASCGPQLRRLARVTTVYR